MTDQEIVNMISNDEQKFEVDMSIARYFKGLCPDEYDENDKDIDCKRISGELLEKMIKFCKMMEDEPLKQPFDIHKKNSLEDVVTQEKYLTFIKDFDKDELLQLIQAANYADTSSLLDLSILALCSDLNNKTADEIKSFFNIQDDSN